MEALISQYLQLLEVWNRRINLVQRDTLKSAFDRHIVDSLQIYDLVKDVSSPIIDIGSGAGFPGAVLSIYGINNVVLCEKNFKKASFLRELKNNLMLNYEIFNDDIIKFQGMGYISVSRAFGNLSKLLDIMLRISSYRGIFHKGERYMEELEEASNYFDFEYDLIQSRTNRKSRIIDVRNIRRKTWER